MNLYRFATAVILLGCLVVADCRAAAGDALSETEHSLVIVATPEGRYPLLALVDVPGQHPTATGVSLELPGRLRPLLRHQPADPALAAAHGLDRTFVLDGLDAQSARAAAALLGQSGWCEEVVLDRVASTHSRDNEWDSPDDPLFGQQYALRNSGQTIAGQPGVPGADIRAIEAWAISRGSAEVTVAVFDAGISQSHPDLAAKLVPGWNFLSDSPDTDDKYTSHGTHCAGIIAAITANRSGVAGISWHAKLMPIVVLNKYGFGNESTLAEALVWAADEGVQVASVSLGFDPADGGSSDRTLHAAVRYATERGMLICASSGNVPDAAIGAPARYPETLAVGATDNRDQLWNGTSTGAEMGVVAPGVSIVSTWDSVWHEPGEDTYAMKTGTSQACPQVAGLAALLYSINPQHGPRQIKALIQRNAVDLGPPGWDPQYGHGRIDAAAAARDALPVSGGDSTELDLDCIADFNGDGTVNSKDFIVFLTAFQNHDRRADLSDPVGVFNSSDVIAYLEAWAAGCD